MIYMVGLYYYVHNINIKRTYNIFVAVISTEQDVTAVRPRES